MQLHPTESGRSASTTATVKERMVDDLRRQREREVRSAPERNGARTAWTEGPGWTTCDVESA